MRTGSNKTDRVYLRDPEGQLKWCMCSCVVHTVVLFTRDGLAMQCVTIYGRDASEL